MQKTDFRGGAVGQKKAMLQTTRIDGKRVVINTSSTGKVTVKPAPVLEWEMQAAAVRELRNMPEYGKQFLLAGDFNAGRRSAQESAKAIATGLTSGEHDLRIYIVGGRLGLIEFKACNGRLSSDQIKRHFDLFALGFNLQAVVKSDNEADASQITVNQVRSWISANDQECAKDAFCDGGGYVASSNTKKRSQRASMEKITKTTNL